MTETSAPLILAAFRGEVAGLLRKGKTGRARHAGPAGVITLSIAGRPLSVGWTGIGAANACAAAKWLTVDLAPSRVILTGYAGAASPELIPGELVLATEVRGSRGPTLSPDAALGELIAAETAARPVPFATVEKIVESPAEKAALARQGVGVVEMESHAAAEVFAEAGIPWACLRAVLDGPTESLKGIDGIADERGSPKPLALITGLAKDPRLLRRLTHLASLQRIADRALSRALERVAAVV